MKGNRPMRRWAVALGTAAVVLSAVAVLAPSFIGRKPPRSSPAAEAIWNLRILRLLEERHFAERGRYAPEPDATTRCTAGANDIQAALPDFRPGPPDRLLFDYSVASYDNGAKFAADATGRAGTAAAGKRFSIDQDSREPKEVAPPREKRRR